MVKEKGGQRESGGTSTFGKPEESRKCMKRGRGERESTITAPWPGKNDRIAEGSAVRNFIDVTYGLLGQQKPTLF